MSRLYTTEFARLIKTLLKLAFIFYKSTPIYVHTSIAEIVQTTFFGFPIVQNISPACKIPSGKSIM